jgi:dihydropteroate synthase
MKIAWSHFCLDFSRKTHVMGIVNVTPDSFSDGGAFLERERAIAQAEMLAEQGADILDIGGESTRPGSDPVPFEEEVRRTMPVIESVAKKVSLPISIDTYKAAVAQRALDAGASMVNDVSGLSLDPDMARLVATYRVPVIVMHIKGKPKDMQENPVYHALIPEIKEFFRQRIAVAVGAGIPEDLVIIDPGIGFGKTFDHNLQILRGLGEFGCLGRPVAVGVSRKAFLGKILDGASVTERLEGTAAAVAVSIMNGAHIVRVHDVKEMVRVAKVVDAIKRGAVTAV